MRTISRRDLLRLGVAAPAILVRKIPLWPRRAVTSTFTSNCSSSRPTRKKSGGLGSRP